MELVIRFLVGGLVVSLFAVLGDALKPKSFGGLFAAAPSVAMAALSLAIVAGGKPDATLEARSMVAGAIAFLVYAFLCARVMAKHRLHVATVSIAGLTLWLGCALGGWLLVLR